MVMVGVLETPAGAQQVSDMGIDAFIEYLLYTVFCSHVRIIYSGLYSRSHTNLAPDDRDHNSSFSQIAYEGHMSFCFA